MSEYEQKQEKAEEILDLMDKLGPKSLDHVFLKWRMSKNKKFQILGAWLSGAISEEEMDRRFAELENTSSS